MHSEVSLEWQVRVVTSKKTWRRLLLHELRPPARPTQVRGLIQRGGSTIRLMSLTNKENSRVCLQSGYTRLSFSKYDIKFSAGGLIVSVAHIVTSQFGDSLFTRVKLIYSILDRLYSVSCTYFLPLFARWGQCPLDYRLLCKFPQLAFLQKEKKTCPI